MARIHAFAFHELPCGSFVPGRRPLPEDGRMHPRIPAAIVLGALILWACSDQLQPPTEQSQPSAVTKPVLPACSTQAWLTDIKRKNALVFSGSLLSSANDKVTAIYNQCRRGAQADAQKKAIFFVDWMFKKYRAHLTASSARAVDLASVTSAALSGVGLQTGSISPATFGPTGGAGSYDPAQSSPTTVTTINQNAGVQLPGTSTNSVPAFKEPTLITLIQLPDSPQLTGEGAPPGDQQFPPNYDINAINASGTHEFQAGASDGVVSICLRSDITYPDDLVIGHTTFAGIFEFLPPASPIAEVTCGAPTPTIGAALPPGLRGLALSAWRTGTRYVGPVARAIFLPQPLNATARTGVASGSARSLSPFGITTAPASEFTSVSSGQSHTCARVSDGTARCWGDSEYGQAPASQAPPASTTFTQVSAGAFHTCARVSNGTVGCWGHNTYGEAPASQAPPASTTFTQVSGGGTHTCALVSDGTLGCWGDNFYGETPSSQAPPEGTTFSRVSAGGTQTCVLKGDGTVGCWGDNTYGQSPASREPPTGTTFTQVSAGYFHTCALVSDGTVSCWGGNFYGETDTPAPAPGTTFIQVSATLYHTCALVSNGTVRCWGNNADGFAPESQVPPTGTTFTEVSAAFTHQCALMSDGRVGCWGGMIGQTTGFHIFTP
jgi:hypothetical protein